MTILQIIEEVWTNNLNTTLVLIDFFKVFDSICKGKMEQILLAYGLLKEIVTTLMMLYKNMKAMVYTPDEDRDFFDIIVGILQGDALASYMFIFCQDNIVWTSIDLIEKNGFTLKKTRKRRYFVETKTDVDIADNVAVLANTPAQAEFLLLSLEQEMEGIDIYGNANKIECFLNKKEPSPFHLVASL